MVDYMHDFNAKMAGTKFVNSSVSTSSTLVHTYPPMQLSAHVFQMCDQLIHTHCKCAF